MKKLPWKQLNKRLEKAISSNVFSDMQEIHDFILYNYTRGVSLEEVKEKILKFNFKFSVLGIDWLGVILGIVKRFEDAAFISGTWDKVIIYKEEVEKLQYIKELTAQQIMYLLLIIHKWNNHISGWVDFPRMACFDFWEKGGLTNREKEEVMRECTANGLELRVVGNKNPIICFNINWLQKEGKIAFEVKNELDIEPLFKEKIRNE